MKLAFPLKRIHFVGIGGIGMSAIAEILDDLGYKVQGSDAKESPNTLRLKKKGIKVFIGHDAKNIKKADALVVSSAIREDNPEYREAVRIGMPIGHRAEMLAEILRHKQGICISGTHGKTTTSSLITTVLLKGGLKPSFVIGGILNSHKTNSKYGSGTHMVVEADESDGSFLKLPAVVSVVTNIDPEHMDHYKTFDMVEKAYEMFLQNTAFYGFSVVCIDHPVVERILPTVHRRHMITYGLDEKADIHAKRIRLFPGKIVFDVFVRNGEKFKKYKNVKLAMFGVHNVRNALAAIAVGLKLGISMWSIRRALSGFKGIQRRLTLRGHIGKIPVYDDYGHHPVEIKATLNALKSSVSGRVVALFEPHRYTRLSDLWADFCNAFEQADVVIVAPVYAAGEAALPGISHDVFAKELAQKHPHVILLQKWEELSETVRPVLQKGDTFVALGAGSVSGRLPALIKELKRMKV